MISKPFIPNMGSLDRIIRLLTAAMLIYIALFTDNLGIGPVLSAALVLLGMINLLAAIMSFCPLYHLVNINTHPDRPRAGE